MEEEISGRQRKLLKQYTELLASYGGKIRLTGPSDPETIWQDHIQDCLFTVPFLPAGGKVVDVGSGGGLPGLVWAVMRPDLEITLLDSVRKKCGALEEIGASLGLSNIRVVWGRCEEFAANERELFDFAGARAVAETGLLAEYLAPLVKAPGGRALAMKGPGYAKEIEPLGGKWQRLGFDEPAVIPYSIRGKSRYLLLWMKKYPCPKEYPRRTGTAAKNFWWR